MKIYFPSHKPLALVFSYIFRDTIACSLKCIYSVEEKWKKLSYNILMISIAFFIYYSAKFEVSFIKITKETWINIFISFFLEGGSACATSHNSVKKKSFRFEIQMFCFLSTIFFLCDQNSLKMALTNACNHFNCHYKITQS